MGQYHPDITTLALLLRHRRQSINLATLAHIDVNINRVVFYILKLFKNTARSFHGQSIEPKAYHKEYINTSHSRNKSQQQKKLENPKIP